MKGKSIEFAAVTSAAIVLMTLALTMRVLLLGDGHYYYGMMYGFAGHWSPALLPDVWQQVVDAFGPREQHLVREGKDGLTYALHFFAYSLSAVPFYRLADLLGFDGRRAFMLANAAYITIALCYVLIASRLAASVKWTVAIVFLLGSAALYFTWPSPEVMSSSLLLVGAAAFLDRRYVIALAATALGSLQNPSIAAFAALILAVCGVEMLFGTSGRLLQRLGRLVLAGLAFALCLLPYAWSMWKFGVLNPIMASGFIDYSLISPLRLSSFLVDLNQGLIVGLPFLAPAFALLVLYRLVTALLGRGPLVRFSDLLLLGFLTVALPVLAQRNWNAGQTLFIRYAAWSGMLPVLWCAYEASQIRKGFGQFALALGIAAQAAMALSVGGINVERISNRVTFKPWVTALWSINPQLYDPLPDIFYERLVKAEAPIVSPAAYHSEDGAMLKLLVRATTLPAAGREVCGRGASLSGVDSRPTSAPVLRRSELDYSFVSGRLSCRFGIPAAIDLKQTALNRPLLTKGWARFDASGSWSISRHPALRIRFKKPVTGRVLLRLTGYGYALAQHPDQEVTVTANGTAIGNWTVRYPDVRFSPLLAIDLGKKPTHRLDLAFSLPDAVSPESLGQSDDTRALGIHLERIELSRP